MSSLMGDQAVGIPWGVQLVDRNAERPRSGGRAVFTPGAELSARDTEMGCGKTRGTDRDQIHSGTEDSEWVTPGKRYPLRKWDTFRNVHTGSGGGFFRMRGQKGERCQDARCYEGQRLGGRNSPIATPWPTDSRGLDESMGHPESGPGRTGKKAGFRALRAAVFFTRS